MGRHSSDDAAGAVPISRPRPHRPRPGLPRVTRSTERITRTAVRRGLAQRRRVNRSLWTASAVAATVVASSALLTHQLADSGSGLQPVAAYTVGSENVTDTFGRTVESGLGRAVAGGAWSVTPASAFDASGGTAHIADLSAGHSARAVLSDVAVDNEQLRTSFALDSLPETRGVYFALETRRQDNGDAYRTRAFVAPNGEVRLDIVQVADGKEKVVTNSVIPYWRVKAKQLLTLETYVTGTAATGTNLKARVWPSAEPTPSWQITSVQTDAGRITRAGHVGLWLYTSIRNSSPQVTLDDTRGWQLTPTKPSGSPSTTKTPTKSATPTKTPTKSATPTKTPTTSSKPPSTSRPPTTTPTTSSSPVKTSSAPSSGSAVAGPSNTGVPAGTKLTVYNGDLRITKDGASYSGLDVRGFVKVEARNVTIKNSLIRGGKAKGNIGLVNASAEASGFSISDSELSPQYPSVWIDGIKGWNYKATRLNIHGTVDGAKVYGNNVSIQKSWIHDTKQYANDPNQHGGPTHNDGVQILSGSNTTITDNRIEGGDNAALQVTQGHGTVSGLTFSHNQVGGGSCTVNITADPLSTIGSVTLKSNRFLRDSEYRCPAIIDKQVRYTSSDNLYLDNKQPISVVKR